MAKICTKKCQKKTVKIWIENPKKLARFIVNLMKFSEKTKVKMQEN